MNNQMIRMTGGLVDEDDSSIISRFNFKNVSEEIKSIIFDSYASLDDHNVDDCFGLDIETAMKAAMDTSSALSASRKASSVPLLQEAYTSLANPSFTNYEEETKPLQPGANDTRSPTASSNNSVASSNDDDATKPKRPLSAYNLFFQLERERIIDGIDDMPFTADDVERVAIARRISDMQPDKPKRKHRKTHGKITFAELARAIANRWRGLAKDQKDLLLERAALEKSRFLKELEEWTKKKRSVDELDQDFPVIEPKECTPELKECTPKFFGNVVTMQHFTVSGGITSNDDFRLCTSGSSPSAANSQDVNLETIYERKKMTSYSDLRSTTSSCVSPMENCFVRNKELTVYAPVEGSCINHRFQDEYSDVPVDITSLNAAFAYSCSSLFDRKNMSRPRRRTSTSSSSSHYRNSLPTNFVAQPDDFIFNQLHDFAFGSSVEESRRAHGHDLTSLINMQSNLKRYNESMDEVLYTLDERIEMDRFNISNEKISRLLSSVHDKNEFERSMCYNEIHQRL